MNRIFRAAAIVFCLVGIIPVQAAETVLLTATASTVARYEKFIEEKGGDPLSVIDFRSYWSQRGVVDIVLIQQALHLGGMEAEIEFLIVPNPARGQVEVKNGSAVLYAHDIWPDSFDDSVHMSAPVLRPGEFEVLVFTLPGRSDVLAAESLADLRAFRPVIVQSWEKDRQVLESLGFTDIEEASRYELIFKMLRAGRGDFTLLSASGLQQAESSGDGMVLVPLRGMKIQFPYSRHFMVSRTHPMGDPVFRALEEGLGILHDRGIVTRAMTECGFISETIRDWTILNHDRTVPEKISGNP